MQDSRHAIIHQRPKPPYHPSVSRIASQEGCTATPWRKETLTVTSPAIGRSIAWQQPPRGLQDEMKKARQRITRLTLHVSNGVPSAWQLELQGGGGETVHCSLTLCMSKWAGVYSLEATDYYLVFTPVLNLTRCDMLCYFSFIVVAFIHFFPPLYTTGQTFWNYSVFWIFLPRQIQQNDYDFTFLTLASV